MCRFGHWPLRAPLRSRLIGFPAPCAPLLRRRLARFIPALARSRASRGRLRICVGHDAGDVCPRLAGSLAPSFVWSIRPRSYSRSRHSPHASSPPPPRLPTVMSTAGLAAPPLQAYAQPWDGALTATFIASMCVPRAIALSRARVAADPRVAIGSWQHLRHHRPPDVHVLQHVPERPAPVEGARRGRVVSRQLCRRGALADDAFHSVLDTVALGLFMYCMQYYLVLSWGNPAMTLIDVKYARPSFSFAFCLGI